MFYLWGLRPHAPSRRSVRCARLWPTHPPSDLLHVGAAPPRPRRVSARGVAFAGATCFRGRSGSLAPRVRVGVRAFRRAAAALSPPTRPRIFFMWGRTPTPPPGQRTRRGLRGRNVLSRAFRLPRPERSLHCGGCARHAPSRTSLRCARLWPTHPPSDVLLWGRSPHAPAGSAHAAWPSRAQRAFEGVPAPSPRGREGVPSSVGAAPPRPIPEERALRAAPAHPPALGCSICGGAAPTPPPDQQRPRSPEDGPAPSLPGG